MPWDCLCGVKGREHRLRPLLSSTRLRGEGKGFEHRKEKGICAWRDSVGVGMSHLNCTPVPTNKMANMYNSLLIGVEFHSIRWTGYLKVIAVSIGECEGHFEACIYWRTFTFSVSLLAPFTIPFPWLSWTLLSSEALTIPTSASQATSNTLVPSPPSRLFDPFADSLVMV